MKIVGQRILKLLDRQASFSQGPSDLDLWPQNQWGHKLVINNLNTKYEDCWPKHSKAIEQTSFFSQGPCDLDLWPSDLKKWKGSFNDHDQPACQIWWLRVKESKVIGQTRVFVVKAPVTFTFDPKINRGHLIIMTNLHAKYEDCGSKNS
jgi:hypothetical protein